MKKVSTYWCKGIKIVLRVKEEFQVINIDRKKNLVVVENLVKGIRYEFPDEFEHLSSAEIFNNYLSFIESRDGRSKMIQLLERLLSHSPIS